MTPKDKANELLDLFLSPNLMNKLYGLMTYDEAKFAALIVCKQLRSVALFWYYEDKITLNHKKAWLLFFDEVEKEIIKL